METFRFPSDPLLSDVETVSALTPKGFFLSIKGVAGGEPLDLEFSVRNHKETSPGRLTAVEWMIRGEYPNSSARAQEEARRLTAEIVSNHLHTLGD